MAGSCPPRFATGRSGRSTYGGALVGTASRLGATFMPWQEVVADTALEHEAGRLAYRDVVVTVPRQSGKTTLLLAAVVHRMLAAPGQRIAYGAQNRLAARGKLFDTLWPLLRRSPLGGLFRLTRGMGAESLRCSNGSLLTLLSTEESAGHGETLDLVVLDECWALTSATEQAVRPALVTRPNGQLWMLSTAGTDRSAWWRSKVEAGRLAVTSDLDCGGAYFEWSAPEGADVSDPELWSSFMPALGHIIDEDVVAADLAAMAPGEWRRAYANQWPDESQEGWAVVDRDAWKAAQI